MSPMEVCEGLGLRDLKNRKWHIQGTCAVKGDGLYEGLDWLASTLKELKATGYSSIGTSSWLKRLVKHVSLVILSITYGHENIFLTIYRHLFSQVYSNISFLTWLEVPHSAHFVLKLWLPFRWISANENTSWLVLDIAPTPLYTIISPWVVQVPCLTFYNLNVNRIRQGYHHQLASLAQNIALKWFVCPILVSLVYMTCLDEAAVIMSEN